MNKLSYHIKDFNGKIIRTGSILKFRLKGILARRRYLKDLHGSLIVFDDIIETY